jgi:glycosyltransferase involved in cell wall biosynthesis
VKVLLLHQHFNTPQRGGPIRSYYLAKALVDAGAKVIVISAQNIKQAKIEFFEGIEVHYLPVPYDNRFGFYRRLYSFAEYVFCAIKLSRKFRDADVCYAISVPLTVGLVAIGVKRRFKIPFTFEVGDLWPDAPVQLGFIKNKLIQKAMYWLEKKIYRESKSIVALSEPIAERIKAKLHPAEKEVTVIPNMSDNNFYHPEEKNPMLEAKYGVCDKFVISYIGAVGFANGLDFLLECARVMQKKNSSLHFLICGEGAMLPSLKQFANQLGLANLSFIPFADRDGVKEIINVTDASFISYRPVEILETGSPNKYFDGLAAGKLIIVNFGGWIKEEIEREQCGVSINPKNPESFDAVMSTFIADKNKLKSYQSNARRLAERKYSRELLCERYVKLIMKKEF